MTDPSEGVPIFVDVGTQDQFPMQPGSYALYSNNMSKHLEQNVKQENMDEGMLIAPDGQLDQSAAMDFDFPIPEKQETTTKPGIVTRSVEKQAGMSESQTDISKQNLGKYIKCTEVINGMPCKIRRVSLTQLEVLWRLLNANKEIVSAYNRSLQDKEHAKKKWTEMAQMLNSIDRGVRKDWRAWSKYWVDFKAKLKRRMAAIKASQTGAGPSEPPLTDLELKFSRLLDKKPSVGDNSAERVGDNSALIRPGIRVEPLISELTRPSIKEERIVEQVEMVEVEVKIEPQSSPTPPPLDQPEIPDATGLRNPHDYPNHIYSLPINQPSSSVDDTQNDTQNSRKRTHSPTPNCNSPPSADDTSPPSANDSCPSSPNSNYCPSSPDGNVSSPNPPTPVAAEEKSPPKRRRRPKVARMTHDMARRALVESSRIQSDAALRSCLALERIAQNTHDILIQLRSFYKTDTEDRLIRHVRKIHRGENPFQCTMCEYSTYNKAVFEEHVRIHQGIKPFKCSYCPYASVSKKNTKKHEQRHTAANPLKCPQCDFFARHDRSLQIHMRIHNGGLKCPLCAFKADNPRTLASHKQRKHRQKEKLNIYECDKCDTKFQEERSVITHTKKAKTCPECGVQLCTKIIYNTHMATVHQIEVEGVVTFKCALCEWSSSNKPKILLHLIHHPGQHVDESVVDLSILKKYGIM